MWVVGERENKTGEFYEEMGGNRTMENNKKKTTATSPVICLFVLSAMP